MTADNVDWNSIDWDALERLRAGFLSGAGDYWRRESDLQSYDATFGRRIAWKWRHVLGDLAGIGWTPPDGDALDWACGSGVAAREFLRAFPKAQGSRMRLADSSRLALNFAHRKVREEFPSVQAMREAAHAELPAAGQKQQDIGTLLVSHVLGELGADGVEQAVAMAQRTQAVIWVESGLHETSRQLIEIRRRLLGEFHVVAPCTHQGPCGLLEPVNERHWCHHFAKSPQEIFADAGWSAFGRICGIDLSTLPLSYLVLDRRPAPALPVGSARIIGRPRVYKAYALLFACDGAGVRDVRLMKRHLAEDFRILKRGRFPSRAALTLDGIDIMEMR